MTRVRLLDLGEVSPLRSQTVYHAASYALTDDTPDTIILVSSDRPYACVGFHQDLEKEIDLAYCQAHGLPVLRREVGGGAVYLDNGQVFVQWVFQRGHLPASLEERFALYVRPLVETYQALGIPAYFRPINDIHVSGKKIGGTGAAQMGGADVVVGSLMFTFDKAAMVRVLRIPSEKMRDKVFESLQQYMTTMAEQLGRKPDRDEVVQIYLQKAAAALGAEIYADQWSAAEEEQARDIDARFLSDEWLCQRGSLRQTGVKIHQDVRVAEGAYKAPGGLIRAMVRLHDGYVDDVALSGDFTMLPPGALPAVEQSLQGVATTAEAITAGVQAVYRDLDVKSPGVTPADFAAAILTAAGQH